jgi:hypothetical protein
MHLKTLTFVGSFDFIGRRISLETQQDIKITAFWSLVRAQKGLATAKEKGEIVSHCSVYIVVNKKEERKLVSV